jgi:hypothetical protein
MTGREKEFRKKIEDDFESLADGYANVMTKRFLIYVKEFSGRQNLSSEVHLASIVVAGFFIRELAQIQAAQVLSFSEGNVSEEILDRKVDQNEH